MEKLGNGQSSLCMANPWAAHIIRLHHVSHYVPHLRREFQWTSVWRPSPTSWASCPQFCGLLPVTWPLACVCGQLSWRPMQEQPFQAGSVACGGVGGVLGRHGVSCLPQGSRDGTGHMSIPSPIPAKNFKASALPLNNSQLYILTD